MSLPRILIVGDAFPGTGLATVIRGIAGGLSGLYEFHQLALNYFGDPHTLDWKLYPAYAGGDLLGYNRFVALIESVEPDLIFVTHTIPCVKQYLNLARTAAHRCPVVAYCPVESLPLDADTLDGLDALDVLAFYTRYAADGATASAHAAGTTASAAIVPKIVVIPHGVDRSTFFPLDGVGKQAGLWAARTLLFGDDALQDAFIVLNANRNQPRKRIDLTVRSFALFAEGKPAHVRLYLHMGMRDQGWHVPTLAKRYGIEDRLIITSSRSAINPVTPAQLNQIYNACDVGLNTSSAEGWGLVSFEHAATRKAQLVPGHTGPKGLWSGHAELLQPSFEMVEPESMVNEYHFTPESVAASLERVYRDEDYRDALAESAYANACRPEYEWRNIATQWDSVFRKTIADGAA